MPGSSSLYDAQDVGEGLKVLQSALPVWVAPSLVVGASAAYLLAYKSRKALNQWRNAQRNATLQRYQSLSRAASMHPSPSPEGTFDRTAFGASSTIDYSDPTQVTEEDVEEFRHALGLMLPRDADLVEMIEQMLMEDPIPDGWVLYRCSFGGLRFRNESTEELRFFHPMATEVEDKVRRELAKRDQAEMAMYGAQMFAQRGSSGGSSGGPSSIRIQASQRSPAMFGKAEWKPPCDEPADPDSGTNTFANVFDFFLAREKETIEQEVVRSIQNPSSAMGRRSSFVSGSRTPRQSASMRVMPSVPSSVPAGRSALGGVAPSIPRRLPSSSVPPTPKSD
jgi:hypothetical protein